LPLEIVIFESSKHIITGALVKLIYDK